jgi:hypothetical protein
MHKTRTLSIGRIAVATAAASLALGMVTTTVFAGEITGNGTLKEVNGRSFCAFSGQEDLQWYTDDTDTTRLDNPVKGVPGHAQNWGQIPQDVRAALTAAGQNPGIACNPNKTHFGGI